MKRTATYFWFYLFAATSSMQFVGAESKVYWVGHRPPYYYTPGNAKSLEDAKKACKADKYERGNCDQTYSGSAGPAC